MLTPPNRAGPRFDDSGISSSDLIRTASPLRIASAGPGSTEADASTDLFLSAATWSGNGRSTVPTSDYFSPADCKRVLSVDVLLTPGPFSANFMPLRSGSDL